jgi:cellulose biosynthesis protein BcsQ
MSIPVITFFNNKGGVGKTSLVFHLAWMFSNLGRKVVAIDLDPQASLTAAFLDEDQLERLWLDDSSTSVRTIHHAIRPLTEAGDILTPESISITDRLHLIPGDLALSGFEDFLSQEWPNALGGQNLYRPFRILTAFWQAAQAAARVHDADMILADAGPNLGAINRSVLIGSDHVVIPLAADLFSLQGLKTLGPGLRSWRADWHKRVANWPQPAFPLPGGAMRPAGYVIHQHGIRLNRPVKACNHWLDRIPEIYRTRVLGEAEAPDLVADADPHCLATLKHYRSLVPMWREARKPIFSLAPADGAIGSHVYAVRDASADFKKLAEQIIKTTGLGNF